MGLLEKTAELGVLSKLEKQGLTLEKLEELLPAAEELGLLSLVGNNQQLLINGVAPSFTSRVICEIWNASSTLVVVEGYPRYLVIT